MRNLRSEQEIMKDWRGDASKPLVSICCLAYNHELFIEDALGGFLIQRTDFPFEILIHDDASTDRTADIIREYEANYPNLIKPIYQRENQYSHGIRISQTYLYPRALGKYIAICEGDDYWIDSQKLQKQFNYLEANPSYGLLFTDADHLREIDNCLIRAYDKTFYRQLPVGNVLEVLLYGNPYKTCTSFFKTSLIDDYNNIVGKRTFKMGDYTMWITIASKSKVAYLNESTAVYRIRENSVSHSSAIEKRISFLKSTYKASVFFSSYYHVNINKKKLKKIFHFSILNYLVEQREFKTLLLYADCFPLACTLVFKNWLHYLIVEKNKYLR